MKPFGRKIRSQRRFRHRKRGKEFACPRCLPSGCTLADVPPGCQARVAGFSGNLKPDRSAYLQAYGLMPGHWVRVVQHSPVMVVQVEHTEIAIEQEMALEVNVDEVRY